IVIAGDVEPGDAMPNPDDCVPLAGFALGWTGAVWERLRSGPADNSSIGSFAGGVQRWASLGYVWDVGSLSWIPHDAVDPVERLAPGRDPYVAAVGQGTAATGEWGRLLSGPALAAVVESIAAPTSGVVRTASLVYGTNGGSVWTPVIASQGNLFV